MAQAYSISFDDEVAERLEAETSDYGDNRSAVVNDAMREFFELEDSDD